MVNIGLCEDRHPMPSCVDDWIFPKWVNPLNVEELETIAYKKIKSLNTDEVNLYVTGLSVALVAAINVCNMLNIKLVLFHYNSSNGKFYPQWVWNNHPRRFVK